MTWPSLNLKPDVRFTLIKDEVSAPARSVLHLSLYPEENTLSKQELTGPF